MPHPGKILLVEDDTDARAAHEALLRHAGHDVVSTGNGLRAVELAAEHLPAVAFVDLLLPGQSGFRVTLDLKARLGDRVTVILMSGTASSAQQDYAAALGAESVLLKPLAEAHLLEALAALSAQGQQAPRPRVRIGA
ncbi:MAG: response regulator [Gemmata sp.]